MVVAVAVDEDAVLEQGVAQLAELLGAAFEVALYRINGGEATDQVLTARLPEDDGVIVS